MIGDQPACGFITIPARAAVQRRRAKPCCLWSTQSSFHQHHHRQQEHCISYKRGAGLFAFLLLQVPCCAAADVTAACTATCRQAPASLVEITIAGHRVAQAALHVASRWCDAPGDDSLRVLNTDTSYLWFNLPRVCLLSLQLHFPTPCREISYVT